MTACDHDNVRVGIVLEVDDSPITLYIWAHLVAATLVDELAKHGVIASLVRVDIDDLPGRVRRPSSSRVANRCSPSDADPSSISVAAKKGDGRTWPPSPMMCRYSR